MRWIFAGCFVGIEKKMRARINMTIPLCAASFLLCLMFFFPLFPAAAAERAGDEFLAGYIASILERDLLWERDSYIIKIVNGVATVTLFKDDPVLLEEAGKHLRAIEGLQGIEIEVKPADAGKPEAVSRFLGITGVAGAFPMGELFRPLIADPKQTQFFVSFSRFKSSGVQYNMTSV
ncbi:MAG: hypothetical protein Q8J64_02355, partial [Thermodesulfovibrionales bacterium]|nr:hypothetical protein [Thermodesulfovibrionales bacterium]